ncbi:MAG: HAMP domain-containing protein [Cyanobacteria bacterium]|nr:HAMP domain-containing protein [Cyanobacteriota bacterium]
MMRVLGSITNRIFLASALLAMLSIAAAVYFVSSRMTTETETELQSDLREAATLVEEQRVTQFDNVARTARLIADLPKLKAAVDTGDRPTLMPIAADYQQQSGADLLIVTGARGEQLALIGESATGHAERAAQPAADGSMTPSFWPHPSGVLEVVSVPVMLGLDRPDFLGTLTLGYLLDDRRAAQFKSLTGADIAFAMDGAVRASTLGLGSAEALSPLIAGAGIKRISIGGEEYVAIAQPFGTAPGPNPPTAIIMRSRSERMRSLSAIQAALAGIALGATLLAIVVSYGVARTITRPLASITDHMRQIAATGDLTRKLPTKRRGGWDDEDAHVLATTFNTLTDSIVRFQREAAQRERLSSLGRLSTVIAHEVRNPLMIIKGALRTMDKNGATTADVRDAAKDIDEEIDRLNNLVNDVLDVARPIRFDPAPADINVVCRDAVQAASAGRVNGPVAMTLAPSLPELITDSERLRTVLVNLLTNAGHAIEGKPSATVTLITQTIGERRVAVTIRDTGKGIAEDDLPRIFDPYFTTRRAGTGLGLAIAKNIVEGLGGSISVATRPGAGTDFRIDIGDAPARAEG